MLTLGLTGLANLGIWGVGFGRRSFLCGVARKRGIETIVSNEPLHAVSNEPLPADHRIKKTDSSGDGDRRDRIFSYGRFQALLCRADLPARSI
jgi:hypothetical protein